MSRLLLLSLSVLVLSSCASRSSAAKSPAAPVAAEGFANELGNKPPQRVNAAPGEARLTELTQYTFGGENAEAYFGTTGTSLTLQAKLHDWGCDRILRMDLLTGGMQQVSSAEGATTCAHYLPGDEELVYASTHESSKSCPPKPDMSQGYVWALYDSYEIYRANKRGGDVRRLTDSKGYDAEATVCAKDGSIVFTSTRDGDIELYRMDSDGKNVKRLTRTPGYDGGAFFNADCSRIVWRASRPKPGKEFHDYQALLAQGLVRPSKLELFVANADGSEPMQLTYLNAASFAPFFHPSGEKIIFSSNYGDPKGREFDIWLIDATGANLERVTTTKGFDGFPVFSPDGTQLAFSSNRATAEGRSDTNVFVARWNDKQMGERAPSAASRVLEDVKFLAAPEREGRGIGTKGAEQAAAFVEERFKAIGLLPAGDDGTFRQTFPVVTKVTAAETTAVQVGDVRAAPGTFTPLGFSADGDVSGEVVFVGYGIRAPDLKVDDYAGRKVKGKIALARRFTPENAPFTKQQDKRRYGDLRHKAWTAREAGAKALIIVDWPETSAAELPAEATLPALRPDGTQNAGLPVVAVQRAAFMDALQTLTAKKPVKARVTVALRRQTTDSYNIVARLSAGMSASQSAVVVGAHYDHLGFGGYGSLTPDSTAPHLGADDNASGVAGMLEAVRILSEQRSQLRRDIYFVAFAGEELGVLGSTAFTRAPPKGLQMKDVVAMLNLDMVGRLRDNTLQILGVESGAQWRELLTASCTKARLQCAGSGDGYGPSDHTPFYAAKVPVLHFFTGAHSDYHKPSDVPGRVNAGGVAQISQVVADVALTASTQPTRVSYRNVPAPTPSGDMRSFNASLGTIPDYAPPAGTRGVLLAGVRAGGAAEQAGMRRGDVLTKIGNHDVGSVQDLMFALNASKPGETVTCVVLREGSEVKLSATFQEAKRH